MPHEDWKFCLIVAMASFCFVVMKADIIGIILFAGYYYMAISIFNKGREVVGKFAIKTKCRSAYSSSGDRVTEDGYEIWVCKGEGGWVEATGSSVAFHKGVPIDVKVFDSKDDAKQFIKTWKGHPWYYVPNGEYTLVEIESQYEQVILGYKEI